MKRFSLIVLSISFVLLSQIACEQAAKDSPKPGGGKGELVQQPEPEPSGSEPNGSEEKTQKSKSVKPTPEITFDSTVHNFRELSPGVRTSCEFDFINTGSAELIIERVQSTCGCTVPKLKKKRYAPGESGTIVVKYHAGTYAGKFSKRLYVHNNSPENRKVPLVLKGKVELSVAYKPRKIKLLHKADNAGAPSITLRSKDGKPFAIKSFSSPGDCITASFDPSVKKREFVIEPRVDTEKLKKYSLGSIRIGLTHPKTGKINIRYHTLEKFKINPRILIVRDPKPGAAVKRTIWVLNNYEEDFEISSVRSKEGIIELLDKKKYKNRYELRVKITPPRLRGKRRFFSDTFHIKLDSGEELSVNCQGFYR